jgi:hypothetical protein
MYANERESITVFLPDAGGDQKFPIFVAPSDHSVTIEKATFLMRGGVTANTANYLLLSLENGGTAGTATTNMGGTAGGTIGFSDNVPQTVTPDAGSGRLLAGEVLVVDWDEVLTGPNTSLGVSVTVEYVHGLGSTRN